MTTKAPRQRPGKPFPGGKKLRKALARLTARKASVPAIKGVNGHTKTPGSMK
jgi:hypothetical protein